MTSSHWSTGGLRDCHIAFGDVDLNVVAPFPGDRAIIRPVFIIAGQVFRGWSVLVLMSRRQ